MNEDFTFDSVIRGVKQFFYNVFGPRKHARKSVNFSSALRVKIIAGKFEIEGAPADISNGGIGLELSRDVDKITRGQKVRVCFSLDGTRWDEIASQVRYILPPTQQRLRGLVGIQFDLPQAAIIKKYL